MITGANISRVASPHTTQATPPPTTSDEKKPSDNPWRLVIGNCAQGDALAAYSARAAAVVVRLNLLSTLL